MKYGFQIICCDPAWWEWSSSSNACKDQTWASAARTAPPFVCRWWAAELLLEGLMGAWWSSETPSNLNLQQRFNSVFSFHSNKPAVNRSGLIFLGFAARNRIWSQPAKQEESVFPLICTHPLDRMGILEASRTAYGSCPVMLCHRTIAYHTARNKLGYIMLIES